MDNTEPRRIIQAVRYMVGAEMLIQEQRRNGLDPEFAGYLSDVQQEIAVHIAQHGTRWDSTPAPAAAAKVA